MTVGELAALFDDVTQKYAKWARLELDSGACARNTAKALSFPFPSFRNGQHELAKTIYRAVRDGLTLFAQAPTGVGKTISSLFAAVKAHGEGLSENILSYAKNITRAVAQDASALWRTTVCV